MWLLQKRQCYCHLQNLHLWRGQSNRSNQTGKALLTKPFQLSISFESYHSITKLLAMYEKTNNEFCRSVIKQCSIELDHGCVHSMVCYFLFVREGKGLIGEAVEGVPIGAIGSDFGSIFIFFLLYGER